MKKFVFTIFLLFVSIIGFTQDETYKFNNMFSISVSKDLELRQDDDAYTKYLNDTLSYVANSEIVFQQKGLSNRTVEAQSHYCRIMIMTYKDDSCPFPSSDDQSFSADDLNEFISMAHQELGTEQRFVIQPTATIETTLSGATYVKIHYTRTGTKDNVSVNLCCFFNYDCAVKAIFSYRESEKDLWELKLLRAMNSFAWRSPYISQAYSQYAENSSYDKNLIPNNNLNPILIGILTGILLMGAFMGITYVVKSYKKK
ncbi:MAG: hypothetical protein IJ557_08030 [Bacteroidaceae bacterium]|nr:hypothetical protein [Bacteroidaceae bacterium]